MRQTLPTGSPVRPRIQQLTPGGGRENKEKPVIQIKLTPEQQEQVRQQTGTDAAVIGLTVQELEERIAPGGVRVPGVDFGI